MLTIKTDYFKNRGYMAVCPFHADCPRSPGRKLPFVTEARTRDLAVASMNAHLEVVHGIDGSVPRRVVN